jgi:hypothetical protein
MTPNSNIKITVTFNDPDLEPEERDEQAQRLMTELKQMDELESVNRVLDPNPPESNKAVGCRSANRGKLRPLAKNNGVSFRVVCEYQVHTSS